MKQPIQGQSFSYIETNQWTYTADQPTSFHMLGTLMFNGLIQKSLVESSNIPRPLGLLMS